ncbi:TPA: DUF551 domain-containing protein [Escherichia coli]|nr:DUF551 domain-containing protein [Escherichia coli]HCK2361452.1 DUF551 domain-containing protein [Escherichia coli]
MTTITKERLLTIKQWRETYGPDSNVVLPAEEAEELARIALASLEAKPIGAFHIAEQQVDGTSDYLKDGEWPIDNGIIEVYAAPPIPVVPEEKPMPNPLKMYAVDAVAAIAEVRGWNACRAAMLQSQGNCIKDGWISCSDRMPEDTKMLLAFSQGEIVAAYWNWVVNPSDYKKYRAFTYLSGNILDDVTHWMPLPEPPL